MPYQLNSSKLFLTYPQCNLTKEEALGALSITFQSMTNYIIAQEHHANGDLHIHAYIELDSPFRTRDATFADILGYHGNYQGCRSSKRVIQYCTKEEDYLSNMDVAQITEKRKSKKAIVGKALIDGDISLKEAVEQNPEYLFEYTKLKFNLTEYIRDNKEDPREDLPDMLPNPWGLLMRVDTDKKCCHYWVWSHSPNRGKTTGFGAPLHEKYRSHYKTTDFTYWTIKESDELIILDEFRKGSMKAQQLNSICDGNFEFRIFMKGLITLKSKPLVVVISNFNIEEVFPFMYETVKARFIELNVD